MSHFSLPSPAIIMMVYKNITILLEIAISVNEQRLLINRSGGRNRGYSQLTTFLRGD